MVDEEMEKLILGLDGMDFDIAIDLNLSNVLQTQFDRIQVPISKAHGFPASPEVWASFLCGEHVTKIFEGRKRIWARKYLKKLKKMFPFISLRIGKRVMGQIVGFPELDKETWIDLPNVKEFNSPYYSYTNEYFKYLKQFGEDKDLNRFRNNAFNLYEKDSKNLLLEVELEMTQPECDILFAYLHFPDVFSHLWFKEPDVLYSHYQQVNEFVKQVLDLVGNKHVIIISDHGFDISKGAHSDFGFISSNRFMNFPKDIISLGKLVYEYAGVKK